MRYSWYALGLLALTNLLSFVNRNVVFALFDPIKRDLHLTDAQLGWLASAYVLVFALAALPFGLLGCGAPAPWRAASPRRSARCF